MNLTLSKPHIITTILLILLIFLLNTLPGIIFCIFLTGCLFYLVIKSTPPEDRGYTSMIILAALSLRLIIFIILQYYCFSKDIFDIFGDAADNILRGSWLTDYLRGTSDYIPPPFGSYNTHGLTYFNGIFFAFFDKDIISLKYINLLAILLSAWLMYDLTKKIYSLEAARIAMAIILFWPTLLFWSLTDLKESQAVLAIVLILWSMDMAIANKGFKKQLCFISLTIISSVYLIGLRSIAILGVLIVYFMILLVYFIFRWYVKRSNCKEIRTFLFIMLLSFILFLFKEKIFFAIKNAYIQMIGLNIGFLNSGGYNYNLLGNTKDFYTLNFFLKFLFAATFHFLFEPLPWNITSIKMSAFYPLIIFWYFMIFLAIIGIIKIYRIGLQHRIFSPLVFLILYVVSFGMSVANIGTAVRFRDGIMPILAILASCGLTLPKNTGLKLTCA